MKKQLGLMVLAGSIAFASLAAAQIPVPPAPPAAPAPAAVPDAVPAPPPAPPSPAVAPPAAPAPVAALAPPPAPAPMAAAIPQPPQTPPPAKAPKPARPAEPARAAEAPPAPPAAPQLEPPGRDRFDKDPVNVRFDVTVSSQTGAAAPIKRSATVTISNGGALGPSGTGMLRSGNSIPVPTTTLTSKGEDGKETPAARPMTSYNYRSIGLNVDVSNVAVLVSGRVQAVLNIEFSGVDDKVSNATGAPSFPTFSQRLSLFFESGKPILVAQSSDLVDNLERKQTVEVKATILR